MANSVQKINYSNIDASPIKSFFVSMLTRDIKLEDAILDLLDNCVDGILRNKNPGKILKPYRGFKAQIEFKKDLFSIHDNCGGIPWSLHDYAFKMGRSANRAQDVPGTVGVYGIGMKRAIFKLGEHALISTQNENARYEVEICPEWLKKEDDWTLPVRSGKKMKEDGTTIVISKLHKDIVGRFGEETLAFKADLERMIATHYAFIIEKGFEVTVNGRIIKPYRTKLVFSKKPLRKDATCIRPFMWKTKTKDGVEVFISVGFTRSIPTAVEIENEQERTHYSSIEAGWTVLCNDRAVLYCDRTELTGWGEAGVPRYHTQFIAISGIVEFKADDASKLPTTTTKRGIDASSRLYLQVKNKMREGMRIFIDYTNKWKGNPEIAKGQIESEDTLSFDEIKVESQKMRFRKMKRAAVEGEQFIPKLPLPNVKDSSVRKISFVKEKSKIQTVAEYLFKNPGEDPSKVGEKCFDIIFKESDE